MTADSCPALTGLKSDVLLLWRLVVVELNTHILLLHDTLMYIRPTAC